MLAISFWYSETIRGSKKIFSNETHQSHQTKRFFCVKAHKVHQFIFLFSISIVVNRARASFRQSLRRKTRPKPGELRSARGQRYRTRATKSEEKISEEDEGAGDSREDLEAGDANDADELKLIDGPDPEIDSGVPEAVEGNSIQMELENENRDYKNLIDAADLDVSNGFHYHER